MIIKIPEIKINQLHWKVGDNIGIGPKDPDGFGIGQIALVKQKGDGAGFYDAVFYDNTGKERGRLELMLRPPEEIVSR